MMNRIQLCVSVILLAWILATLSARAGGSTNLPTSVSGGVGTVSSIQANDAASYTVAQGESATISGFSPVTGAITSVYLFVEYAVDAGYNGTEAIQVNGVDTTMVPTTNDWVRQAFLDITGGSFGIDSSSEITTLSITFANNDSGTSQSVRFDYVLLVINPAQPIHMPPTWSDEFDGSGPPDPTVWTHEEGYKRNNELQYYTTNAWQEGGRLIIEGRREPMGGYAYTSASIYTINKYYWQYGRAQVRAKVSNLAGLWPAIWGCGKTGEWPSGGEADIMENYGGKILANMAIGTTTRWKAAWDSANRTVASLTPTDPVWLDSFHVWTMQWDDQNVRLYVDNVLINTIPQSWMVNPVTTWGPKYPFKQPIFCWLNLAIGGAGGDPSSTSFPQRYYVDYWRIWENVTGNVAPTDIAVSAHSIAEGLPAGTMVGYLSATDADPAEVIRYSLVTGTGSTDNSLFSIPEFLSDNPDKGVLKTAAVLSYAGGATRSIRVRATDIEGATFDKILMIGVLGASMIDTSTNVVVVAEGSTSSFGVRLRTPAENTVTVNVARVSGGTDLAVTSGSQLLLGAANGTNWQQVTISAAEDSDRVNSSAAFRCSDAGGAYLGATVTVYEADNDNLPPVADAGADQMVALSGSSPWTPAAIPTVAWYDAADDATLTTNTSGAVSQWRDKSGNGHNATQGTGTAQPARQMNQLNGLPTLYFDGGDSLAAAGSNAFRNLFAVFNSSGATFSTWRWLYGTLEGTDVPALFGSSGTSLVQSEIPVKSAANNVLRVNGADNTGVSYSFVPLADYKVVSVAGNSASAVKGGWTMGAGDAFWLGSMAEIITTDTAMTTETRQQMEGYLAHKWGLSSNLPDGHPYKNAEPGAAYATVSLDGTVSDPNGDTLSSTWSRVSGPGAVSFGNSNAVDTTVTFTREGVYVLRLTVSDGVTPSSAEVTITVNAVTAAHSVPYTWLADQNPSWTSNYEAAVTNDADHDGFTTAEEYWSGTDPMNSRSFLHIAEVQLASTNVRLIWAHSNVHAGIPPICVQTRSSIATGSWQYSVEKAPANGFNSCDVEIRQGGFYRLCVTNMP